MDKNKAATYQSGVNLVLVPVVVRDSQGRAIGNLTKNDFQLFDRGKRQTITGFSAIDRAGDEVARPAEPVSSVQSTADVETAGSESAGVTAARESPERFLIYLFDDRNTEFANMVAVREAAERHLERGLAPMDRAAIYTVSGRNGLDFTRDRDMLEAAIKKLNPQETPERVNCPYVNYYLADLIVKKGDQQAHEAVVEHTMSCAHVTKDVAEIMAWGAESRELVIAQDQYVVALRALRRAIEKLAVMPGQRLIVFASPGFFAQSPEAIRQTTDVLNLAVKAHVIISGLDPKGVSVGEPNASDSVASTLWPRYLRQSAEANDDVIADLANGTGGIFFRDNDDLAAGFERTAAAPQFSYMLGFTPAAFKSDGRFHLLKVRLINGKGFSVQARHGYYALRPDTEEQAASADIDGEVFSRDQINDIPIVLQTGFSKINGADHATVMVVANVDGASLHFQKTYGLSCDSLIFVSVLFDQDGGYVNGTMKTLNLRLRDTTLASVKKDGITLHSDFDEKPGKYSIRLVLREVHGKAITTITRSVVIP